MLYHKHGSHSSIGDEKILDIAIGLVLHNQLLDKTISNLTNLPYAEDLPLGSVVKKRRKKMRKHKHRKLLARTRHQRRKGR